MTAIALIVADDYVLMAGDGVATAPETGDVVAYVSKLSIMPEINALIGISGIGGFDHLLGWFMPQAVCSFDDLVETLPDLVRHCHRWACNTAAGLRMRDTKTNVVIAGWSDLRDRYEAWRVVSYPKESTNIHTGAVQVLEPWTLLPLAKGGMWCSSGADEVILKRFRLLDDIEGEDDAAKLTRMICAARAGSGFLEEHGYQFNAGAFVQLALLQRGHAQTWIAHRWPEDELGRPVNPDLGEPLPAHLMAHDDKAA